MIPEPTPDAGNLADAAWNRKPKRTPVYDHDVSLSVIEEITGAELAGLRTGDRADRGEFFRRYTRFFRDYGYDTVTFEALISSVLPGNGALYFDRPGSLKSRADCNAYPWQDLADRFFDHYSIDFELLAEHMPPGMKAVGGPGNGVFECVQDIVGYDELCYIRADDPELYSDLFTAMGDLFVDIWRRFLPRFGNTYAVCRFGDDLGFKSSTLLPPDDIRSHLIPQYARVVSLVHEAGKPFLLHSCGNIFNIMDDLIDAARIDAKHSNEDIIAPFTTWVGRYGERIGNFGGIDTDVLCTFEEADIRRYTTDVYNSVVGHGGIALGSGNSIPDYTPPSGYLTMLETVRKLRGELA